MYKVEGIETLVHTCQSNHMVSQQKHGGKVESHAAGGGPGERELAGVQWEEGCSVLDQGECEAFLAVLVGPERIALIAHLGMLEISIWF